MAGAARAVARQVAIHRGKFWNWPGRSLLLCEVATLPQPLHERRHNHVRHSAAVLFHKKTRESNL